MGISAKELDVNTAHINALADQIRFTTDCEVLQLVVEEHLKSVKALFDDIKAEQKEILSKILPLLTIPAPTPQDIIKWVKKFVASQITPQMRAQIAYIKKMIKLAIAIEKVVSAVASAIERAPDCFNQIQNQVLDEFKAQIDGLVNDALSQVAESQSGLLALVDIGNSIPRINTSSPRAFLDSVDDAFHAIDAKVKEYVDTPAELQT